jgi:hypothetical protein
MGAVLEPGTNRSRLRTMPVAVAIATAPMLLGASTDTGRRT